jgi:hypothetical protein
MTMQQAQCQCGKPNVNMASPMSAWRAQCQCGWCGNPNVDVASPTTMRQSMWQAQCQCRTVEIIHHDELTTEFLCVISSMIISRGHRDCKKMCGVAFFSKPNLGGLTNYVIRHSSIYSNMTSLPWPLCPHAPRCLTHLANPPHWCLFEGYTLKVVLHK